MTKYPCRCGTEADGHEEIMYHLIEVHKEKPMEGESLEVRTHNNKIFEKWFGRKPREPLEENDFQVTPFMNSELQFDSVSQMLGCGVVISRDNLDIADAEFHKRRILDNQTMRSRVEEQKQKAKDYLKESRGFNKTQGIVNAELVLEILDKILPDTPSKESI